MRQLKRGANLCTTSTTSSSSFCRQNLRRGDKSPLMGRMVSSSASVSNDGTSFTKSSTSPELLLMSSVHFDVNIDNLSSFNAFLVLASSSSFLPLFICSFLDFFSASFLFLSFLCRNSLFLGLSFSVLLSFNLCFLFFPPPLLLLHGLPLSWWYICTRAHLPFIAAFQCLETIIVPTGRLSVILIPGTIVTTPFVVARLLP